MTTQFWLIDLENPDEQWGEFDEEFKQTLKADELLKERPALNLGFIDVYDKGHQIRTGTITREFLDDNDGEYLNNALEAKAWYDAIKEKRRI